MNTCKTCNWYHFGENSRGTKVQICDAPEIMLRNDSRVFVLDADDGWCAHWKRRKTCSTCRYVGGIVGDRDGTRICASYELDRENGHPMIMDWNVKRCGCIYWENGDTSIWR